MLAVGPWSNTCVDFYTQMGERLYYGQILKPFSMGHCGHVRAFRRGEKQLYDKVGTADLEDGIWKF